MTASDRQWSNEWIRIRVSKIEWFYVSKQTKGQCGRPIRFLNNFTKFSMQYVTTIRTNRSQVFFEIGVLKVCNIYRKMPVLESLFSKVASLEAYKETPTQMFSCEYCELFKKILFKENNRWLLCVSIMYFIFFAISLAEVIKTC